MIQERIRLLREKMKEYGVDVYYIPTNDFHNSEYIGDYFKCREYISGFSGSAGTVIVTQTEAGLWTDGRYFIQAQEQLKGSGITLYRVGQDGVPSVMEYLEKVMEDGQTLGFDGRLVSIEWFQNVKKELSKKQVNIRMNLDLVGEIWENRPALSAQPVFLLNEEYAGESRAEKLSKLREEMKKQRTDFFVLTALDDIAWLLNIRGNDIHCNPVPLAYAVVTEESVLLFARTVAFSDTVKMLLAKDGIGLREYEHIYRCLGMFPDGSRIMVDKNVISAAISVALPPTVEIVNVTNPTLLWKAVKNPVEVESMKKAHIKDGVSVTKLLYWIKKNIGKIPMSEMSVVEKLEEIRNQTEHYMGPSFDTIAGYAEHGAIVHYTVDKTTDKILEKEGFLLLDMGGHYLEGTTDITRTIFLGEEATEEQKKYYTAVLRGNLNLTAAHFLHGCSGVALDILARKPLWDMGCDFNHGTGHGVGYLLNVHESPNAFRYRVLSGEEKNAVLEEGMITSNEPGFYLEGKFGIRLENLILCVKREKTDYGQFMGFEPLTFVPFEKAAIDKNQMTAEEIKLLNEYHEAVYKNISPFLEEEERLWLAQECQPILW